MGFWGLGVWGLGVRDPEAMASNTAKSDVALLQGMDVSFLKLKASYTSQGNKFSVMRKHPERY